MKECGRNQGQEAAQGKVDLKTWGLVGRRGLETTKPTRERTVSGDTAWTTTVYWITPWISALSMRKARLPQVTLETPYGILYMEKYMERY